MKTKYTNEITDKLTMSAGGRVAFKLWGGMPPICMGDGVKFRVLNSKIVDYVYIRYLSGYSIYEVEYAALVGTEYDVLDRVSPVSLNELVPTITRRLFSYDEDNG